MTTDEARDIVAHLNAAFPKDALDGHAAVVFIQNVALLVDPAVAFEAAKRHAQADARFPSIAAFRRTYRAVAEQRAAASEQAAIPEEAAAPEPMTPDGWEALGRRHRELRSRDYGETPDPAADRPLPRNRAQFGAEWAAFLATRFSGGESIAKAL